MRPSAGQPALVGVGELAAARLPGSSGNSTTTCCRRAMTAGPLAWRATTATTMMSQRTWRKWKAAIPSRAQVSAE
jgi:hypothetical protein